MMMLRDRSASMQHILAQDDGFAGTGELGVWWVAIPWVAKALAAGGAFILGGGTLWYLHERQTEKSDYQDCLVRMTTEPYNMDPKEAAMVCSGEVPKGFQFGLNAPTFVLVAASVFGLWFVTQLLISAVK